MLRSAVRIALREGNLRVSGLVAAVCLACVWALTPLFAGAVASRGVVTLSDRVITGYGGAFHDSRLHRMLAGMAGRLRAASGQTDLHRTITVLDSPAVNAFALPDGRLYVTRGLLALANDRAEAASAIALVVAQRAAHRGLKAAPARDRDVATLVASRVAPSASLSPSQMMQADTIGIGIAARAGFDPYGAWRLLESMRRRQELRSAALSSAPPLQFSGRWPAALPDRVRNALESARTVADGGARHRDTTIGGRDPRSPPRPAGSRCGHPPLPSQVRDRRLYPGTSWPVFRLKRTRRRRQAAAPIGAQGMRSPTGRVATMQLGASGRAVAVASPP